MKWYPVMDKLIKAHEVTGAFPAAREVVKNYGHEIKGTTADQKVRRLATGFTKWKDAQTGGDDVV